MKNDFFKKYTPLDLPLVRFPNKIIFQKMSQIFLVHVAHAKKVLAFLCNFNFYLTPWTVCRSPVVKSALI